MILTHGSAGCVNSVRRGIFGFGRLLPRISTQYCFSLIENESENFLFCTNTGTPVEVVINFWLSPAIRLFYSISHLKWKPSSPLVLYSSPGTPQFD